MQQLETSFGAYKFSGTELMEIVSISKPTFSDLQKKGVIQAKGTKPNTTHRKLYDWTDLINLQRRYAERLPRPSKRKVRTFTNLKGGVGKTTTSTQFAMEATRQGQRVLFIDMDPQGNSTIALGVIGAEPLALPTMLSIFKGEATFEDTLLEITPNLHLIPSYLALSKGELFLRQKNNGQMKLKLWLDKLKHSYDIVIIDTNAALTYLSINAILAADELDVAVETELFSVNGMNDILEVMQELHADYPDFNPTVRIIPNKYDAGEKTCQASLGVLRDSYEGFVTSTVLRRTADYKNAQGEGLAVCMQDRKSNATRDIEALTKELLDDTSGGLKLFDQE